MVEYIERGVIPHGNGRIAYVKQKNPYSQSAAIKCPICGENRGPRKNHSRCSRILQQRHRTGELE